MRRGSADDGVNAVVSAHLPTAFDPRPDHVTRAAVQRPKFPEMRIRPQRAPSADGL